jgi:hypothetical protein
MSGYKCRAERSSTWPIDERSSSRNKKTGTHNNEFGLLLAEWLAHDRRPKSMIERDLENLDGGVVDRCHRKMKASGFCRFGCGTKARQFQGERTVQSLAETAWGNSWFWVSHLRSKVMECQDRQVREGEVYVLEEKREVSGAEDRPGWQESIRGDTNRENWDKSQSLRKAAVAQIGHPDFRARSWIHTNSETRDRPFYFILFTIELGQGTTASTPKYFWAFMVLHLL